MNPDIVREKEVLRRRLRTEARIHSPQEMNEASAALCRRLLEAPEWRDSKRVLGFYPTRGEPDILPVLRAALRDQKELALPRLNPATGTYEPVAVQELDDDLTPGAYGIHEPQVRCVPVPINRLDLVLVPGLGFDLAFGRIGRGQGHYDRLLARTSGKKCGVAFDWQVAVAVPTETHDILVDILVTPTRWLAKRISKLGCE